MALLFRLRGFQHRAMTLSSCIFFVLFPSLFSNIACSKWRLIASPHLCCLLLSTPPCFDLLLQMLHHFLQQQQQQQGFHINISTSAFTESTQLKLLCTHSSPALLVSIRSTRCVRNITAFTEICFCTSQRSLLLMVTVLLTFSSLLATV